MPDRVTRGYLPQSKLQIVLVEATDLARYGQEIQGCSPAAAGLFAQTLTAGLLIGALQKGEAHLNIQIECDGPVRGLFADATPAGVVRGYVRNPQVDGPARVGPFAARGALGRRGYVSVLRDVNGDVYRGSVDLAPAEGSQELPRLIERYFAHSEQVSTAVALSVIATPEAPLDRVVGLLVQPLPDGDREAFAGVAAHLHEGWLDHRVPSEGLAWLHNLCGDEVPTLVDEHPAIYRCGCSKERAVRALLAMGREEIIDLWEKEGRADAKCEFCGTQYVITGPELLDLVRPEGIERN